MRILTLLILIAIYATADRPKSPLPVTNAVLNISATPVLNDAKHKDAIAAILTVVGLSSTGQIYYVGEIEPTSAIEGFCQSGEIVLEYRTTHLFNQTAAVVWYNPTSRKLHSLYSQKVPNQSAHGTR